MPAASPLISPFRLALSVGLVLVAGGVSAAFRLGLVKGLLWGTLRTIVQLTLLGYVLTAVFDVDHPALVAGLVALMCLVAARAAVRHHRSVPFNTFALSALTLAASTYLVGTVVCWLIIAAERWYTARIAVPIAGMLLGNSLNGISLSLERFFCDVRQRSAELEQLLCLGYSPWRAIRPLVRAALRAGMTPTINALMVVGIVSVPGMMTGQILAGADPLSAVRYQIVVMLMIAASVALGCLLIIGLSLRRVFTEHEALRPELVAPIDLTAGE